MPARLLNVIRRGGIFHFRRIVPVTLRPRLGRSELVRSLSTSHQPSARLRADLLYRHSQELFAAAASMLSSDEINRLVKEFYELTLAVDDHRRLLPDHSWSESEHQARSDYLDQILHEHRDALRKDDFDKANAAAQVVMARRNVSESELGPGEYNRIRQAILRASIDIIGELRARQDGNFNYDPQDRLLKVALVEGAAIPAPRDRPEPVPSRPAPSPSYGPRFSEVAEAFRADQLAIKSWDKQTAAQARATYRLFAEICGDRFLSAYVRADADEFRKKIQRLPWDYSKAAQYRGHSVDEILKIAAAQSRTRDVQPITQRTVKRHFSVLSGLWASALSAGTVEHNIFSGFRFAATKKASDQRDMWTLPELQKLFASPIYVGSKSEIRRAEPGSLVLKDERYWPPLIALLSGMRQEEIAQLHVEDVKEAEGIAFFDINDRPPRMLKNANAARQVPLHSTLIRAGFMEYVDVCRKGRQTRLFPNLKPGGADNRLGHSFSKWFTRYRRDIGVYRKGLDFHSLRHTASTLMHQAGVERAVLDHVTGHSTPGETSRYVKTSALKQLRLAIDAINIGFDILTPLQTSTGTKAYIRPQLKFHKRRRAVS
jgi:integrase